MPKQSSAKRKLSPGNSTPAAANDIVTLRLRLPQSLVSEYELQSAQQQSELEDLLVARLQQCSQFNDPYSLYLNEQRTRACETALDRKLESAQQLVDAVQRLTTIVVADVIVPLTPVELERVSSRIFPGETFEQVITRWALSGIRQNIGLA